MSAVRVLAGLMFGVLLGLPSARAAAATPAAAQPDPGSSRYSANGTWLERAPAQSASGRYGASGTLRRDAGAPVAAKSGSRYRGGAKLVTTADCSDVLLADSFE